MKDLTRPGPLRAGIGGPVLAGSLAPFIAAYLSVRFLERCFGTRTLYPFAIDSLVVGTAALIWLSVCVTVANPGCSPARSTIAAPPDRRGRVLALGGTGTSFWWPQPLQGRCPVAERLPWLGVA